MRLAALILLAVALALPANPSLAEITGRPRIIDGDTIWISQQRIRLFGIDAPEGSQYCKLDGKPWRVSYLTGAPGYRPNRECPQRALCTYSAPMTEIGARQIRSTPYS